jgi:hypothetical protein
MEIWREKSDNFPQLFAIEPTKEKPKEKAGAIPIQTVNRSQTVTFAKLTSNCFSIINELLTRISYQRDN